MLGAAVLQIILIIFNAVFACAEIAVISTSETRLEKLSEEGNAKARRLLPLVRDSSRALSTIQVAITLASLMGSAYAADNFAEPLALQLSNLGLPLSLKAIENICVFFITIVLSYFSIVVGELVPKRLAMKSPEKTALALSGLLKAVSFLFAPFVSLLTVSTNGLLRLFGINPDEKDENVTEEDIKVMLDTGNELGTIDSVETEMIRKVFEFDDISISEVCTHRTDVNFLYIDDGVEAWRETVASSRHTFYPICGENDDDVIGVLSVRKFFRVESDDTETVVKEAADKPFLVPETMKADVLLDQMRKQRVYFAVVIDEYGGTRGVITLHDILELLVGALGDEDDESTEEISIIADNTWEIPGGASIGEVEAAIGLELCDEDNDTFGGYIIGLLGAIPDDGTETDVETEALCIHVASVSEHRIEKAIVVRKNKSDDEASELSECSEKIKAET